MAKFKSLLELAVNDSDFILNTSWINRYSNILQELVEPVISKITKDM